jgi:hypothetical protein
MMRITSALRAGAIAGILMGSAACSSTTGGGLGGILGSVLGGGAAGGSQVSGTIQGVNTRSQQIGLQQSNGQNVTLTYDNNTQVVYQNQNYSVTSLEYGDRVTARVPNANSSGSNGYYTDLIQVDQSVSPNEGGINNNVQQFDGTVRSIDRTNGIFQITSNNYGTLTVYMPYNPRQTDVNKFNSIRSGDYVRIYGTMMNNSRVQLTQFY